MGCGASTEEASNLGEAMAIHAPLKPAVPGRGSLASSSWASSLASSSTLGQPAAAREQAGTGGTGDAVTSRDGANTPSSTSAASRDGAIISSALTPPRRSGQSSPMDLAAEWKRREQIMHKEGYLHQQIPSTDGTIGWLWRWFVSDYGDISVYEQSPGCKPGETLEEKHECCVYWQQRCASIDLAQGTEFVFVVQLLATNQVLTLRASSREDKEAWLDALRVGSELKANRMALAPLVTMLGQHTEQPHAVEHPTLHIDDIYSMGALLGAGQLGRVYKARHRETNAPVAIKIVNKSTISQRLGQKGHMAYRETEIFTKFNMSHPRIVTVVAFVENYKRLCTVMELLEGGDLGVHIAERGNYSEADSAIVTLRLASTMSFLHAQGIIHRDIKPDNIMCCKDHTDIKLVDFGLATLPGSMDPNHFRSIVGTPMFMAPEIGNRSSAGGYYSHAVDVWSAGITLYYMLSGQFPTMIDKSQMQHSALAESEWTHISAGAKNLLRQMVCDSPTRRINTGEILRDSWINSLASEDPDSAELRNRVKTVHSQETSLLELEPSKGVLRELAKTNHHVVEWSMFTSCPSFDLPAAHLISPSGIMEGRNRGQVVRVVAQDQGKMSERTSLHDAAFDEDQPSAFRPIRDALLPSSPRNQRKTLESIAVQSMQRQSAQTATEPESKPNTETKNKPAKNKRMTLKQFQQPSRQE
jgi:serine/threonine protein kinase